MIPFGKWAPDVSIRDGNMLGTALNVIPRPGFYAPFPAWAALGLATLPSQCLAAKIALDISGAPVLFAGTATKLYRFDRPNDQWDDVSRLVGGNYSASADERWCLEQYAQTVWAVNGNDAPQTIDVDAGTNFAAASGSPGSFRGVATVGDFVVLFNTITNPRLVKWSGLNDQTQWTVGTNFSDEQEIADGGAILGVSDGSVPVILQEEAVRTFYFTGGAEIFQITPISKERGLRSFYGYTRGADGYCYFMTEDGPFKTNGQGVTPVGHGVFSKTLVDDIENATWVQVLADANQPLLYIAYASGTNYFFDKILVYDWELDMATLVEQSGDFLLSLPSFSVTLEELDAYGTMETLVSSLDSRLWRGGAVLLAAISSGMFGYITGGTNKEATLGGGPIQATPGGRSFLSGIRPLVDTASAYIKVAGTELPSSTVTYGSESTPNVIGLCEFRSSARYHHWKLRIPVATTWTKAEGLDAIAQPDGGR